MFNKEYFEKRGLECKKAIIFGEICARNADFYKWVYKNTGLKWAKKRNEYFVRKGTNVLIANLGMCVIDLQILEKMIRDEC